MLAALSKLEPPHQLLADDPHLLGDLGVTPNDEAGGSFRGCPTPGLLRCP